MTVLCGKGMSENTFELLHHVYNVICNIANCTCSNIKPHLSLHLYRWLMSGEMTAKSILQTYYQSSFLYGAQIVDRFHPKIFFMRKLQLAKCMPLFNYFSINCKMLKWKPILLQNSNVSVVSFIDSSLYTCRQIVLFSEYVIFMSDNC